MDAVRRAVRMVSDDSDVVAAGYADYRRFDGLTPRDLVRAAKDAQCDLVMVDTAMKDGKNLFDNMSMDEIREFIAQGREAGMRVALAGSLKLEHAEKLFDLDPDIIGVRGAVCVDGTDRKTKISAERTEAFCKFFHDAPQARSAAHSSAM